MAGVPPTGGKQLPKDALVIISMMKELGITEYEPRVLTQLLEFSNRYVSCVLDDARAFANHSKKKSIDVDDIKLAVMMQMDRVFTSPPPRDLLLEVARTKNSVPLPIIKPHNGIRLPPDRYCFSNCNFKHRNLSSKKQTGKASFAFTSNQGATIKVGKAQPSISVVKRAGGGLSVSQGLGVPQNPVIKFTTSGIGSGGSKLLAKPKIQMTAGGVVTQMEVVAPQIKVEPGDGGVGVVGGEVEMGGTKRKREEELLGVGGVEAMEEGGE